MKGKSRQSNKRDVLFNEDRNAAASKTAGNMTSDTGNNTNAFQPSGNEPDVDRANGTGPEDAGAHGKKLSKFRSNRSMDA